jgi:hypothetical protein
MKDEKEEWTQGEMVGTFANTPHERHSIMVGFANGLSEGSKFTCSTKYEDEAQYYALGWSLGEIIDRIKNNNPDDTRVALAQSAGVIIKYASIVLVAVIGCWIKMRGI